jgi:hypothetical protein
LARGFLGLKHFEKSIEFIPPRQAEMPDKSTYERQIHEKLQRFGVSGPGRDWLLRALHPASEKRCPGLPDQSATPVFRPDYRMNTTISPPPLAESWDCFIWTPPGDVNAVFWATGPAGTDFTTEFAPPGCQLGSVQLQADDMSIVSVLWNDVLNTTRSTAALTQTPQTRPAGFRHMFKSITITQIAAAVADQGQVYAAQFAPNMKHIGGYVGPLGRGYDTGIVVPGSSPSVNYCYYGALNTTVLPAAEGDLTAMAPDFYMGASRDGVYLPLRLSGPSQPFARAVPSMTSYVYPGDNTITGSDISVWPIGAYIRPTANQLLIGGSTIPWVFNDPMCQVDANAVLGGGVLLDSGYDNINIGVVIFRGLAGANGGGFGASLQLKTIVGHEVAPSPQASARVFTEPAAQYEARALEAYYALCLELKDAYPASYNSLESIWDAIKSVASNIWDIAKPAVRTVAERVIPMAVERGGELLVRGMSGLTGARRGPGPSVPRVTYRAPSVSTVRSMLSSKTRRGVANASKARTRVRAKARK